MQDNNPNSFDKEIQDVQGTNPEPQEQRTEQKETENPLQDVTPAIDYKTKFSESSKEAQRLYEENKAIKEQLELKDKYVQPQAAQAVDNLYPGFEDLDSDAQNNLIAYTNEVTRRAKEDIYKDPAIAFAKSSYNERVWDGALDKVMDKYPELRDSKEEFKSKYYNVNNVPVNIESILDDVAKIHLFDKAKQIGANEEKTKINRIETERTTAGTKEPTSSRTIEDWSRMQQENPQKFSLLSKEFQSDMDSGKLKE